jgi:hypothetical protein
MFHAPVSINGAPVAALIDANPNAAIVPNAARNVAG